jgi:hypothetical protein
MYQLLLYYETFLTKLMKLVKGKGKVVPVL